MGNYSHNHKTKRISESDRKYAFDSDSRILVYWSLESCSSFCLPDYSGELLEKAHFCPHNCRHSINTSSVFDQVTWSAYSLESCSGCLYQKGFCRNM